MGFFQRSSSLKVVKSEFSLKFMQSSHSQRITLQGVQNEIDKQKKKYEIALNTFYLLPSKNEKWTVFLRYIFQFHLKTFELVHPVVKKKMFQTWCLFPRMWFYTNCQIQINWTMVVLFSKLFRPLWVMKYGAL